LTRSVCELHRYNKTEDSDAIHRLNDQGFEYLSIELIYAIYDQLETESEKQMKTWHQNADKTIYYSCALSSGVFVVWSKRYLLSFEPQLESDSHEVQVFDCFNDKSA
jgi:hypothetical protein